MQCQSAVLHDQRLFPSSEMLNESFTVTNTNNIAYLFTQTKQSCKRVVAEEPSKFKSTTVENASL